jgi:hypothetical protein
MGRNDRTSPLCDVSTEEVVLTQDTSFVRFVEVSVLLIGQIRELNCQVSTCRLGAKGAEHT